MPSAGGKPVQTLGSKSNGIAHRKMTSSSCTKAHEKVIRRSCASSVVKGEGLRVEHPQRGWLKQRECEWKQTDLKLGCFLPVEEGALLTISRVSCLQLNWQCDCLRQTSSRGLCFSPY